MGQKLDALEDCVLLKISTMADEEGRVPDASTTFQIQAFDSHLG
jgi:hypothetical protein